VLELVNKTAKFPVMIAARPVPVLHADVRIVEANISQQGFILLAHPRLFVMTSHVVPVHAIIVELIEDGQTVLGRAALNGLAIIGLRLADAGTIEIHDTRTEERSFHENAFEEIFDLDCCDACTV